MEPVDVLASLRPLVVTVDAAGVVRQVFGGYGGFLGLDVHSLVGCSVFDFLPPSDGAELAQYLIESADEVLETVSLPLPFRVGVIGGDGEVHSVDVIVAGHDAGDGSWSWVATLVPIAMEATIIRPLDALVEREPRDRVKALLADELTVENAVYSSRGFFVDLMGESPQVVSARSDEQDVAEAIGAAVLDGWAPWHGASHAETMALDVEVLPAGIQSMARARGWRRASVTPVWVDGDVLAAYVLLGRVPAAYPVHEVRANLAARYRQIARMTGLIIDAWRNSDRLEWAATHDALTGIANRHAFDLAVASASESSALLFIDIDDFKSVNDEFGHSIGDRVLAEVARRIQSACTEEDVVARIGGDEFAVLLSARSSTNVDLMAAAVTAAMDRPWDIPNGPPCVSVSVGAVASLDAGDALERGSHAMLERKHGHTIPHRRARTSMH